MKKLIKKLVSTVVFISILLTFAGAFSTETPASAAIDVNSAIQELLFDYFETRASALNAVAQKNPKAIVQQEIQSDLGLMTNSNKIISAEIARLDAADNLRKYHGVYPTNSTNSFYVKACTLSIASDQQTAYTLDVYEWTWIEYTNGRDNDINRMGYATEHEITVCKPDDKSEYVIISDVYDESDILGERQELFVPSQFEKTALANKTLSLSATNGINSNANMDVNAVIDYADQYVAHEYSSVMMNTSYYNSPEYGYYSNADCANFVSQCLRAGGMSFDYGTGKNNENSDATQWWYDTYTTPTNNNYNVSPLAWRYVPHFILYWTNQGYSNVTATASSVYPGNPVLQGTNHVGICVGYNSAGTPIINAHNRDVYHVPYTMIGSSNRTTIQINTTNKMVWKPSDATILSPTGTNQSILKSLTQGSNHYYKITVSGNDDYIFESTYYSGSNIDTKATLYKESVSSNGETLYLYEYTVDDNSGNGNNFKIDEHLFSGTYYLRVRAVSPTAYGQYYFNYRTY